jgi:hypothetical protein
MITAPLTLARELSGFVTKYFARRNSASLSRRA